MSSRFGRIWVALALPGYLLYLAHEKRGYLQRYGSLLAVRRDRIERTGTRGGGQKGVEFGDANFRMRRHSGAIRYMMG
jgi:hypothetical protein